MGMNQPPKKEREKDTIDNGHGPVTEEKEKKTSDNGHEPPTEAKPRSKRHDNEREQKRSTTPK
jgi:hypothetical protein